VLLLHLITFRHIILDMTPCTSDRPVAETSTRDHGVTALNGPEPPYCRGFTITLGHITLGRTPLHAWSARRRDLYQPGKASLSRLHDHADIPQSVGWTSDQPDTETSTW